MIEGGCFCGKIRYALKEREYRTANCHCSMCRRFSGAPFVTWIVVPTKGFEYTSGNPESIRSSDGGMRYFCASCGTPIACVLDAYPKYIDVTVGSLDDPDRFVPTMAIHEDTKLAWLAQTEELQETDPKA